MEFNHCIAIGKRAGVKKSHQISIGSDSDPEGDSVLSMASFGVPVLEVKDNGDILVYGEKVGNSDRIVDGLRDVTTDIWGNEEETKRWIEGLNKKP